MTKDFIGWEYEILGKVYTVNLMLKEKSKAMTFNKRSVANIVISIAANDFADSVYVKTMKNETVYRTDNYHENVLTSRFETQVENLIKIENEISYFAEYAI